MQYVKDIKVQDQCKIVRKGIQVNFVLTKTNEPMFNFEISEYLSCPGFE